MATQLQDSGTTSIGALSVALIGPHDQRRRIVATALAGSDITTVREFNAYPGKLNDVPRMLDQSYDVVLIDLDSDQQYALQLVEAISANGAITVMVYSFRTTPAC